MTESFAQFKKNSKKELEVLSDQMEKLEKGSDAKTDDRFWKPTADKAGSGSAIIRFLPKPPGEDVPFVRYWDHAFQGPGGWYIENSLTTLGESDPVSEYNTELWNTGLDKNKDIARKQKRKLHYISNILVVDDPANPANNGKVFLFKYGKKIMDKIKLAMKPKFATQKAINPFDLWDGANFELVFYNDDDGYRTYSESKFAEPSPVAKEDKDIEKIWKAEHTLSEFLDRKNFKSYAELQARLFRVLKLDGAAPAATEQSNSKPERNVPDEESSENESESVDVDPDDDDMSFFENLAKDE